jgi:hypothetical protein
MNIWHCEEDSIAHVRRVVAISGSTPCGLEPYVVVIEILYRVTRLPSPIRSGLCSGRYGHASSASCGATSVLDSDAVV